MGGGGGGNHTRALRVMAGSCGLCLLLRVTKHMHVLTASSVEIKPLCLRTFYNNECV